MLYLSALNWSIVSQVVADLAPAQTRTGTSLLPLHLALTLVCLPKVFQILPWVTNHSCVFGSHLAHAVISGQNVGLDHCFG